MRKYLLFCIMILLLFITTFVCFSFKNIKLYVICEFSISFILAFSYTIIIKNIRSRIFILSLSIIAVIKSFLCNVRDIKDPWSISFAFPVDLVITLMGLVLGFFIAKGLLHICKFNLSKDS